MEKAEHVECLVHMKLIAWFVSSWNFHILQTATENNLDRMESICHTCRREVPLAASLKILEIPTARHSVEQ